MKRMLIVSDSHGNISKIDDIVRKFEGNFDVFVHLGNRCFDALTLADQIPQLIAIKGNIESDSFFKNVNINYEEVFEVEGVKIFATHGHRYSVNSTLIFLKKQAKKLNCNLVLYGYSTERHLEIDDGILYFNPGALSANDYGIIEIDNGEIVNIEHGYLSERW